ncbi:MAG: flagellar regulator YcgR PilZN domain-containing protein [Sideroxydans sp.]
MSTPADAKKASPDNLLFHSHIEICRILQMLVHERCHIVAVVGDHHAFRAFMLALDLPHGRFTTTFSANKEANSALLNFHDALEFTATDAQGLLYSFEASSPEETQIDGQPAIHFNLPKSLLLHNRREHVRLSTADELSLRCVADAGGFMPFESHITDVSHDGLGALIYDLGVHLVPGAILKGSRIITPNGDAVTADLELRHITTAQRPDGTMANRAGFRFLQAPSDISQLIGLFIQNMDKK